MHVGEVETSVGLVRRLLDQQYPQWSGLPVSPVVSAGTVNALYRVGDELVARLPRVASAVADLELERRWLPRLAPVLPVRVPVPVAVGVPGAGYPLPWAVYSWLDGSVPTAGSPVLAAGLVEFLAALRRVDCTGAPASARAVHPKKRDAATRMAIAELRGTVDVDAVTAAWERAVRVPAWDGPPVWVHGDLSPFNLLTAGGRLTGVIDWGCAGVGDPACDLIPAWNLLPADARDLLRAGVDEDTWERGRGWALTIALVQLPYYRTSNPVLAENSRATLAAILAE